MPIGNIFMPVKVKNPLDFLGGIGQIAKIAKNAGAGSGNSWGSVGSSVGSGISKPKVTTPKSRPSSKPASAPNRSIITSNKIPTPRPTPTAAAPKSVAVTPPAPKPVYTEKPIYENQDVFKTIQIPNARSDPDYIQSVADLSQALAHFKASQNLANSQYNTNLNTNFRHMGYNANDDSWNTERGSGAFGTDYNNNMGDFAGRGAFNSGVYRQALNDLAKRYNDQVTDMETARNQFQQTQDQNLEQQEDMNTSAMNKALQQAIARIAADPRYGGLDLSDVPTGKDLKGDTKKIKTGTKRIQTGTKKVLVS